MGAKLKLCTKCGFEKSLDAFHRCASKRDGRVTVCKSCIAAYGRIYRPKTVEAKREADRLYRIKNKEAVKAGQKRYAEKNRKRICERAKEWQRNNPEAFKARRDKWTRDNKERVAEYKKRWVKEKRALDPVYYLTSLVQSQVNKAINSRGGVKPKKTSDYIGCDWDDLITHIERQFTNGMNWENRGEWHLDHIIPLSTADTVDAVAPLLHFTNLRPLWAKDNLEKSDKRTLLI